MQVISAVHLEAVHYKEPHLYAACPRQEDNCSCYERDVVLMDIIVVILIVQRPMTEIRIVLGT